MAIDDAHLPPPPLTVPTACRPPPRHAARSHSPPTPTGSVAHTTTRVVRVGDACDRPARTRWRRRRRWECDCARRTAGTLPPPPPPPPPARHVSRRCARGGQRGGGATRVLRTNAPGTSTPAGAPPPAAHRQNGVEYKSTRAQARAGHRHPRRRRRRCRRRRRQALRATPTQAVWCSPAPPPADNAPAGLCVQLAGPAGPRGRIGRPTWAPPSSPPPPHGWSCDGARRRRAHRRPARAIDPQWRLSGRHPATARARRGGGQRQPAAGSSFVAPSCRGRENSPACRVAT